MRFGLLAAAGWLGAAVLTVAVSWSAVGVVRDAVDPAPVVAAALPVPAETPSATASSSAGPTRPGPSSSAQPPAARLVSGGGRGGSVAVRCSGGVPVFVNIAPSQGYTQRLDDGSAEVEFSSSAGRTEVKASCSGSVPRLEVEEKGPRGGDDDGDNSGPGGGNSGPGGGNSGPGGDDD